jgi:hypothetical protein
MTEERGVVSAGVRLFLLGFLTLFLELVLIRYLAGNIWNLGYFPNFVLLAAFLGIGIGYVFHSLIPDRRSPDLYVGSAVLLLALSVFVAAVHPSVPGFSKWSGQVGGELFFSAAPVWESWATYPLFALWFLSVVGVFALLSQFTAKLFRQFAPLRAYTLDIAGSCVGILAFMGMSLLRLPAYMWFLAATPVFALAVGRKRAHAAAVALALVGTALVAYRQDLRLLCAPDLPGRLEVRWSPYQKVENFRIAGGPSVILVNGISHQQFRTGEELRKQFYQHPHARRAEAGLPPFARVLVIGAGVGNDVAAALQNGAVHVDAVEIDPVIAEFGRDHAAKPYDDPRVHLVVQDGRAVLNNSRATYDLILFALTDSLVKVSGMAQLRLENYLFTVEAVRRAWSLLSENGELVLYNSYRQPWIAEKIEGLVAAGTGRAPLVVRGDPDFFEFSVSRGSAPASGPARLHLPTDGWPFLYLRRPGIPRLYVGALAVLGAFIALLFFALRRVSPESERIPGRQRTKLAFVLMGAAFLLLETMGVIQFSLLFGTTWWNSSLVFLAILVFVLAANRIAAAARRLAFGPGLFGLLALTSLIPVFYPLAGLLSVENLVARYALASLLTFSPVFLANLLFSVSFRDQPVAEHLFGWNLLGATIGGVLEYLSLWFGYPTLSFVVAGLYAGAFALLWNAPRESASSKAAMEAGRPAV